MHIIYNGQAQLLVSATVQFLRTLSDFYRRFDVLHLVSTQIPLGFERLAAKRTHEEPILGVELLVIL